MVGYFLVGIDVQKANTALATYTQRGE